MKALSLRASDRYTTASDFAEDLRHFVAQEPIESSATLFGTSKRDTGQSTRNEAESVTPRMTDSDSREPIKIVPKGLRSFDEHDADFFLELLPGPRDRDGLPDSIRFWKTGSKRPIQTGHSASG